LALKWLRQVFIPETQRGERRRLLILDGHNSHTSGEFQYECMTAGINVVYLPPHSSHLLQPLNVGPFSPLAHFYAEAVKKYTPSGLAPIDRAIFNNCYQSARPRALTKQNIQAGWSRSGIEPANPVKIILKDQVQNLIRTTPEVIPPPFPDGVYMTPQKVRDVEALVANIEGTLGPNAGRAVT
jgi:DDE superfamily endonuclease